MIFLEKKWGVLVKSGSILVKSGGVLVNSGGVLVGGILVVGAFWPVALNIQHLLCFYMISNLIKNRSLIAPVVRHSKTESN